ncbi:hypothetical protein PTTG_04627 [Puccinia triticina 1-1 BBBD Race 1]|uniref:LIM zinc-binding domain-containing protein n=1 Tax=Puccinia triticina (isolate 1-1 / race 1 (BBBD)) TaxID=630390 RepID=A0A180GRL4_PUCT1|nr:hypothetical protein PTTG_04627 [Puccinia triticina 1-1 BBBD Race 1]
MSTPLFRRLAQYNQPQPQAEQEQEPPGRPPARSQSIKRPLPPLPTTPLTPSRAKPLPQPPPPAHPRQNDPTTTSLEQHPYRQQQQQQTPASHFHPPSHPRFSDQPIPDQERPHGARDALPTLVVDPEEDRTEDPEPPASMPEIVVPRMVFNDDDCEDAEEQTGVPRMVVTAEEESVPGITVRVESPPRKPGATSRKPFIAGDEEEGGRRGPRPGGVSGPRTITPQRRADRVTSETRQHQPQAPQTILAAPHPHPPPPGPSDPGSKLLACNGCRQLIAGRIVHAINARWHPDCFVCQHCGLVLEHVAFYEHEGKAYCGVDYDDLFSLKCYHCNTSINEDSYVTLDDASLPDGPRHYHKLHLFCSECGDPFIDPKSLEERSRISRASAPAPLPQDHHISPPPADPKPFVMFNGFPYCEKCDIRLHRPKCFACKAPIVADFVNALNKLFHSHCFVCFECTQPFSNNQFFLVPLSAVDPALDPKSKRGAQQVPICLNCYS